MANSVQFTTYERGYRQYLAPPGSPTPQTDVALGLLPQSHIYALVATCHSGIYRGDQTVVLPKFEINSYLAAIENYKIGILFVVCNASSEYYRESKLNTTFRSLQSSSTCSGIRKYAPSTT